MRAIQFTEIDGRQARQCNGCGVVKPFDLFPWDNRREKPYSRCFDCDRAARLARYKPKPRKPPENAWTPEEDALLRQWARDPNMPTVPGRTYYACRFRCSRLGIKRSRRRSKWRQTPLEAAVIEAADKRISFSVIAKRHGITKNTVAGIIWRWRKRRGG